MLIQGRNDPISLGVCQNWRIMVAVAVLTLGVASAPLHAQGPTALSLSWSELEVGCETPKLVEIDLQECQTQLARWQAEYDAPRQHPDMLLPTLDRVLAELPVAVEPEQSLWNRVWQWLRELLGGGSSDVPDWLRNWDIPETFVDWMIGLSVGACVLLALGIVGNELLQVYRSRAMPHVPGAPGTGVNTNFASEVPRLADVPSFPLQEQPGILLHIVLHQLQQRSLVARQIGRTHQDLLQQAPQLGELGGPLADIAQAAERSTYGDWQVSITDVEPLLAAGKRLVALHSADAGQEYEPKSGSDAAGPNER